MENTIVNAPEIDEGVRNEEAPQTIEVTPSTIFGGILEDEEKSPIDEIESTTVVVGEEKDREMPPTVTARGLTIKEEYPVNVAKPTSMTATEEVLPTNNKTSYKADDKQ